MCIRDSSSNDSFYANPEVDALLDAARAELDPARRAALYRRVERILYDDAPWIWDYHRVATEVIQPYVRDFQQHPIWTRDYTCLLYTSDAADERSSVDLGGRRIIKK